MNAPFVQEDSVGSAFQSASHWSSQAFVGLCHRVPCYRTAPKSLHWKVPAGSGKDAETQLFWVQVFLYSAADPGQQTWPEDVKMLFKDTDFPQSGTNKLQTNIHLHKWPEKAERQPHCPLVQHTTTTYTDITRVCICWCWNRSACKTWSTVSTKYMSLSHHGKVKTHKLRHC